MSRKPREPATIAPVVVGGVRYEAPWSGAAVGVRQDGGVVAAFDAVTDALLWAVSVYPPNRESEDEDGDVYITSMMPDADGATLVITNQAGEEYRLDLSTHAVTRVRIGR